MGHTVQLEEARKTGRGVVVVETVGGVIEEGWKFLHEAAFFGRTVVPRAILDLSFEAGLNNREESAG